MHDVRVRNSRGTCCVIGCTNAYYNTDPSVKFYTFPGKWYEAERRNLWIERVGRADENGGLWQPKSHDKICSLHFVGNEKSKHPQSPSYNPTIFPDEISTKDHSNSGNFQEKFEKFKEASNNSLIRKKSPKSFLTNRWTVPQIEALIEQYKKYPVLYATNHERHTDRALKNECLRNIVSALETIRFGVTEADVVTQWNNLVLKYVQTPQVQEGTSSTGEERQVWYFQKLQFLEDHLNTSNIKLEEYGVETDQMEMFEPEITTQIDLENSTLDPLAASIKIEVEEPCLSEPTMKHENTAEMNGEDVKFKDENDIFGDFVAAQLKKITDDEVRQDAVFEIHKILHTALRKK